MGSTRNMICNLKGQLKKRTAERNEARAKVEALFSMCKIKDVEELV